MKHALIAATLLSVGGLAVGCGGGQSNDSASGSASSSPSSSSSSSSSSSASSSAGAATGSASDMCNALSSGASIQNGQDVATFVDTLKKAGTPSDAPADAQKGFDVYVGVLGKIDPKASAKDLQKMGQVKLSSTQKSEVQSFLGYASQTCAPAAQQAPSSGAPSAPSSSSPSSN